MAKAKISAADYAEAHKQFVATLTAELPNRGLTKALRKFKGDGPFARRLSRRQYQKFLDDGGRVGDWKEFADWLIENLPKIISLIMALFV